jgi:hypothetical protein
MTRHRTTLAVAAALAATLALAGCKKKDEAATTPPPAAEPAATPPSAPAPAAAAATVTGVELGSAVGADNRVTAPTATFAATDTIHASVATDGPGGNLTAKWSYQDGQTVESQDKVVAAGPQVTDFSISKPGGWPLGKYKLEVLLNGSVIQTRELEVR